MAAIEDKILRCDVLVVGGGGAGLSAAIRARERGVEVVLVSKSRAGYGNNTFLSKGVFAAARGEPDVRDSPDVHFRDSVIGGRFINDQELLYSVVRGAADQIPFLQHCGALFHRRDGKIVVTHTPGHAYARNVRGHQHVGKDFSLPLREQALRLGVRFVEKVFVTRLLTSHGRFAAATGISQEGRLLTLSAPCVVLATGGYSQVFLNTNNAPGMTGDGLALALDLGLPLKDMEFVQFYPTAMGKRGTRILLYEAFVFRGGAVIRNREGEDILAKHGLDVPTRDQLARVIMTEIQEGYGVDGGVIMDLGPVNEELLSTLRHLLPAASGPVMKTYVVSPTTHFCMGGLVAGRDGATDVPGVFAAGEVCAGVHGANRLAGNALAEVFVMGGMAGRRAAEAAMERQRPRIPRAEIKAERERLKAQFSEKGADPVALRRTLKEIMWQDVGIVREGNGLETALEQILGLKKQGRRVTLRDQMSLFKAMEWPIMIETAEAVCRSALLRTESRGAHHRRDYPEEDEHWIKNIVIHKKNGRLMPETAPVSFSRISPRHHSGGSLEA
jgi:fumarate reductase (CoM/CoB) subunit A